MSPLRAAVLLSLALAGGVAAAGAPSMLDEAPSRYATLDGVRIHYKLFGRGRTALVFVHNLGGDMSAWGEQVPFFEKLARVAVIDLPGYGGSDKPEGDYSTKMMAKAVRAVLDDARIDRAILIGHSTGSAVIRQFDRTFPWRTRALAMVDPSIWSDDRIVVPLLVIKSGGPPWPDDYVQSVKAMADEVDFMTAGKPAEVNTLLEKWLTAKKLLR